MSASNDHVKILFFFNWRISALQCCVGFCHTIMQNSHKYTHAPSLLNLLPTSHPIPSLQVVIGHQVELPMLYNIFPLAIYFTYAVLSPTLCDPIDCSPSGSSVHGDSPGKNTGTGCHALFQRTFPTQGSNPGLPHCR